MSLVKHDTMAKHKTGPDNHGTADVSVWNAELLTDVSCSEEIWQKILGMWKDPVQPVADAAILEQTKQHGQAANKLSLQHQLDLFCRKAIFETMQQLKANEVHTLIYICPDCSNDKGLSLCAQCSHCPHVL